MKRRNLLTAAPAVLAVGAVPAAHGARREERKPEPLVAHVQEWRHARDNFETATRKPDGTDFDSLECLHWQAEWERIEEVIRATPPQGVAGIGALMDFL